MKRGDALTSPAATRRFLQARLRDRPQEVFALLLLDNQHRVLQFAELFSELWMRPASTRAKWYKPYSNIMQRR